MDVSALPTVNAILNSLAAVCMATGWILIRRGRRNAHRAFMLAAVAFSACFMASYVVYHAQAGSRPYTGAGALRTLYFLILITHIVLAALIVPLVLVTLVRALRGRFARHRALARWTLPIWVYVSVTGVIVYVMLY